MPIDLNPSESETAQFAAMQAEEPVVETPAPEAEPAPQPEPEVAKAADEPAADPAPEQPADDPEKVKLARHVPFSAVLEERGKRKEAQDALRAAQEELARLRGAQQPPQRQEEQPTPQTDPIAIIERHEREMAEWRQARQQEAQMGEFQRTVMSKEQEYLAANPDYPKMVEYLKETRVRELREGLGLTDAEIGQAIAQEAAQTAQYALSRDVNPAEIFARMAVAKGWKAEAPKADPKPAPAERLATLAAGRQASKSLSSAGGGAPSPVPTLESIANMSAVEQEQFWKNGTMQRLMQ